MDRVRLGRALGYGTRHAARTVVAVVHAASAPSAGAAPVSAAQTPARVELRVPATRTKSPARELRRSLWSPIAAFTRAVWLQVTGTFFALIACTFGVAAWRTYAAEHAAGSAGRSHAVLLAAVCLTFVYFAVTSFLRANRRGKT